MPRQRLYIVLKEVQAKSVVDALQREAQSPVMECYPRRDDDSGGAEAIGFIIPEDMDGDEYHSQKTDTRQSPVARSCGQWRKRRGQRGF